MSEKKTAIDIERCKRAANQIVVVGAPLGSMRLALIEEAIAAIQADPENALRETYLGIKNYAHFGDQRSDHPYNCGPSHGSIVFEIARRRNYYGALSGEHIYLLECVRDFGVLSIDAITREGRSYLRTLNLVNVIKHRDELRQQLKPLEDALSYRSVVLSGQYNTRKEANDE